MNGQQLATVAAQTDRVEGQRAVRRRREFRQRSRVPEIQLSRKTKFMSANRRSARLELYLRDDVQNFGNFQLTSSPTDGFSAGKIDGIAKPAPPRAGRQPRLHRHSARHSAHRRPNRRAHARPVHRQRRRRAAVAKSGRRSVLPAIFQPGRTKAGHAGDGAGQRANRCRCRNRTSRRISPARSAISP